jgi:hypothetical protein
VYGGREPYLKILFEKIALTIANVMVMQNFMILQDRFVIFAVAEIMYTNLSLHCIIINLMWSFLQASPCRLKHIMESNSIYSSQNFLLFYLHTHALIVSLSEVTLLFSLFLKYIQVLFLLLVLYIIIYFYCS